MFSPERRARLERRPVVGTEATREILREGLERHRLTRENEKRRKRLEAAEAALRHAGYAPRRP